MSTTNDVELISWNFVRNHYENQQNIHVPVALKYMILKFANKIIGCKILTFQEDIELYQLLSTKLDHIKRFQLLFRASDNEYSAEKFHEKCDNKEAILTIIESNWGNIFGGYVSKLGDSENHRGYAHDKDAFLFLIKSDDASLTNRLPITFSCTLCQ